MRLEGVSHPTPQLDQPSASPSSQQFPEILLAKVTRPPLLPSHGPALPSMAFSMPEIPYAIPDKPPQQITFLGKISDETPTVSDMLHQHPNYRHDCWKIINADNNKQKPYTTLAKGTSVLLDKRTNEILFDNNSLPSPTGIPDEKEINVGTLSAKSPTVSHLLRNHPQLGKQTWAILENDTNRNKDFTKLAEGTNIRYIPKTGELIMTETPKMSPIFATATTDGPPLKLGTIGDKTPTVSHLLKANHSLQDNTWAILNEAVNQNKTFSSLRPGTDVFFNPATRELTWDKNIHQTATVRYDNTPPSPKTLEKANRLSEAVRPYFGKSYNEINCYGLVVRGLRQVGIKYLGQGGLRDKLVDMASQRGLPENAYFNGEGLIEATGQRLYSKSVISISNPETEAKKTIKEMLPQLKEGCILSFSTPTRGHTGIIARHDDKWTFINSGEMDNSIDHKNGTKGVGEEVLEEEIKNWFTLAKSRGQSLQVTLGILEEEKLQAAMQHERPTLSTVL